MGLQCVPKCDPHGLTDASSAAVPEEPEATEAVPRPEQDRGLWCWQEGDPGHLETGRTVTEPPHIVLDRH